MAWLVTSDSRVLAFAEIAEDRADRRKGLIGRTELDGVLVIPRCRWVHTVGMRFAIDVAFVDRCGTVLKVVRMRPYRVGRPVPGATCVIEAVAGAFDRWGLAVGDEIEIRDAGDITGLPTTPPDGK